jgi:hypothetical protein
MAIMLILCAAGVAFYLRVLLALCKECNYRWIGYLLLLQPERDQFPVYTVTEAEEPQWFIGQRAA